MKKSNKLLIVIFVFSLLIRLSNLYYPYYWGDEVTNSIWVSGHSLSDFQDIPAGSILSAETIRTYQYPSPSKSALDIVRNLAVGEPQSTPLNYVLLWYWLKIFGYSIAGTRSFIAVVSALCVPLIYWLCQELFVYRKKLTGLVAATLMAVAPIHVVYSHEARPFSLWCLMTLLSTIALLKAMRTQKGWLHYAIASVFSFYTYPFALFTTAAHTAAVLVREHFRITPTVLKFAKSIFLFIIFCLPWTLFFFITSREMSDFRQASVPLGDLVKIWTVNFVRIFWDINASPYGDYEYILPFVLPLAVLLIVSTIFMARNESVYTTTLVVGLLAMNVVPLAIPDLVTGGIRSSITRYFFPAYLAIELPMAYFLAYKISCNTSNVKKKVWQLSTIAIVIMGLFSCSIYLTSDYWHNKGNNLEFIEIANVINEDENAIVVGDYSHSGLNRLLTLNNMLKSSIDIQLGGDTLDIVDAMSQQKSVFLLTPTEDSIASLNAEEELTVERISAGSTNNLFLISRSGG